MISGLSTPPLICSSERLPRGRLLRYPFSLLLLQLSSLLLLLPLLLPRLSSLLLFLLLSLLQPSLLLLLLHLLLLLLSLLLLLMLLLLLLQPLLQQLSLLLLLPLKLLPFLLPLSLLLLLLVSQLGLPPPLPPPHDRGPGGVLGHRREGERSRSLPLSGKPQKPIIGGYRSLDIPSHKGPFHRDGPPRSPG